MATLIVGDLHLGKGLQIGRPGIGNALNSRIIDQIDLLDWVIEQSLSYHVNDIILTGDICESVKPDYILIELFVDFLKKCKSLGVDVHIIAGNHDLKRTGIRYTSYLDLLSVVDMPWVHVYKNICTIFKEKVGFTFVPFRDMRSLDCSTHDDAIQKLEKLLPYELASIPHNYNKVLVGHLAIKGSIYVGDEFDNLSNELMCPVEMFNGYDFVWMGHVHKPQKLSNSPYVAHVGSLDISDFGETDHTKIIVLYDSELPEKFKEIPVPSRPLRHILINVPADADSTSYVIKSVSSVHKTNSLENSIVKIEIKLLDENLGNIDREIIESLIYSYGAFYICSLTESRTISVVPIAQQQISDSSIKPIKAIKVYADNEEFSSQSEKSDFIQLATEIVKRNGT